MKPMSCARDRFPPSVIQQAVQLSLRFALGTPDVEEQPAGRGLEVSKETARRWVGKFGPAIARRLRRQRQRPGPRWRLGEVGAPIGRERFRLRRAVDDGGEVLDVLVQRRRDRAAAVDASAIAAAAAR